MSLFAKCFLLVNLVLVASAVPTPDQGEPETKALHLISGNPLSSAELVNVNLAGTYIGDLTIGERRYGETLYQNTFTISNNNVQVTSFPFNYTVKSGIIHYVSIQRVSGDYGVVCNLPYALGTSRSDFTARLPARSTITFTIVVAAH